MKAKGHKEKGKKQKKIFGNQNLGLGRKIRVSAARGCSQHKCAPLKEMERNWGIIVLNM